MTALSTPIITWTEVVRSRLPDGCTAHRLNVSTHELLRETSEFEEAWSVWRGTSYLGLLARGAVWQWRSPWHPHPQHGSRETILTLMHASAAATIEFFDQNTTESGKPSPRP